MAPITYSRTDFFSGPPAPSKMRSLRMQKPRDEIESFLSSDLEMSFASSLSLDASKRQAVTTPDDENIQPMDVSPLRPAVAAEIAAHPKSAFLDIHPWATLRGAPKNRPRASTTTLGRQFGNDLKNNDGHSPSVATIFGTQTAGKRTHRSTLPSEWTKSPKIEDPKINDSDAMDIDTAPGSSIGQHPFLSSPAIASAMPTSKGLDNLFYDTSSPVLKKRRPSSSPKEEITDIFGTVNSHLSSSPVHESPLQRKLERKASYNVLGKAAAAGSSAFLSGSSRGSLRPRPHLAQLSHPSEPGLVSASLLGSDDDASKGDSPFSLKPVPHRRAVSAMLIPMGYPSLGTSSPDGDRVDSSPADAYTKRQAFKTIRRPDGSKDIRPLTGGISLSDMREMEKSPPMKHLAPGLPGFGDNEAAGKVLPCFRVKDDGLMRIKPKTLDQVLDGVYDELMNDYIVIDCRFDYEYNGGHVPGAINLNTTQAVEEFFLSGQNLKPKQSISTDPDKKTIVIFHCEFSLQRAPTFAKHLRYKDRSLNNHVYPRIHFPEVYILEGGYCSYFRNAPHRCQPSGYVTMDDPKYLSSRREDLEQFRKAKFGRTKSFAYGEGSMRASGNAPLSSGIKFFGASNPSSRTLSRRGSNLAALQALAESDDATLSNHSEDEEGGNPSASPCPAAPRAILRREQKTTLVRAETYNPSMMNKHFGL